MTFGLFIWMVSGAKLISRPRHIAGRCARRDAWRVRFLRWSGGDRHSAAGQTIRDFLEDENSSGRQHCWERNKRRGACTRKLHGDRYRCAKAIREKSGAFAELRLSTGKSPAEAGLASVAVDP